MRLLHVAIAVTDLSKAAPIWEELLGGRCGETSFIESEGINVCFINTDNCKFELMESVSPTSSIAGFLKKNPRGGVHHICISEAENVTKYRKLKVLMNKGVERYFLHPKDFSGVLLEMERQR